MMGLASPRAVQTRPMTSFRHENRPGDGPLTEADFMDACERDLAASIEDGERVSHLKPDACYQAHLSIYRFARPWACGKDVLDAGCGAGYGAADLADGGARSVIGVDVSTKAIDFCNQNFQRTNLEYRAGSLENLEIFADQSFDLIFSSNTLEHVSNVRAFLDSALRLLRPEGLCIVAIPPITNDYLRRVNEANVYHLNIWSPRQWQHALQCLFDEVTCYRHNYQSSDGIIDFDQFMPTGTMPEDFLFEAASLADLYSRPTLTAMFLARRPRDLLTKPTIDFVDDSYTRPLDLSRLQRSPDRIGVLSPPPIPWWRWPQRAIEIAHQQGVPALLHRVAQILRLKLFER